MNNEKVDIFQLFEIRKTYPVDRVDDQWIYAVIKAEPAITQTYIIVHNRFIALSDSFTDPAFERIRAGLFGKYYVSSVWGISNPYSKSTAGNSWCVLGLISKDIVPPEKISFATFYGDAVNEDGYCSEFIEYIGILEKIASGENFEPESIAKVYEFNNVPREDISEYNQYTSFYTIPICVPQPEDKKTNVNVFEKWQNALNKSIDARIKKMKEIIAIEEKKFELLDAALKSVDLNEYKQKRIEEDRCIVLDS